VRWEPRPGQQGRSYVASFVGFIPPSEFGGTACARSMRRIHIEIQVPSYESKWTPTPLPKSLFGNTLVEPYICRKSGVACNGRSEKERVAQCAADKYADVNTNYCGIGGETCCSVESESTSAAPAADLVFSVAPRQVVEGLVLTCQSTVQTPYTPHIELMNVTIASPTEVRALEAACSTGSTCDESSKLGGWEGFSDTTLKIHQRDPADPESFFRQELSFAFRFLPQAGTDDGFTKRWCFACSDSGRMYPPAVQCISITTRVCEVYVSRGDQLQSITRALHLDRNWRRIWNLNSYLLDPFKVLHGDTILRVGPVYTVRAGDTMTTLAARFETTLKRLLDANPHIQDDADIAPGLDMCVVACSNRKPPSHFINEHYAS